MLIECIVVHKDELLPAFHCSVCSALAICRLQVFAVIKAISPVSSVGFLHPLAACLAMLDTCLQLWQGSTGLHFASAGLGWCISVLWLR